MDTNKRELKNKFQFSIFQFQNPHAKSPGRKGWLSVIGYSFPVFVSFESFVVKFPDGHKMHKKHKRGMTADLVCDFCTTICIKCVFLARFP